MSAIWREDGFLGQGGFGFVRLFVNQLTNEKIALKEMKQGILDSLQPTTKKKAKERLITEIKIMWEHNCVNLVKAMSRPQNMDYSPPPDTLHVWMEYCEGGDLRKTIRMRHNCCGLSEKEIRRILSHINSGLIFLHRNHIIHRDLKPENILLKQSPDGQIIYKLTDFGYAKVYEYSSYTESMVGTPQYVAPEILNSRPHGSTVDFWSFGVVTFELCTGLRPFLHCSRKPLDWVLAASDKPEDCIHIYWAEQRDPVKSNKLPQPNNLSRVFAEHLTSWLQMALHSSPDKRGGLADHTSNNDAPCLEKMDRLTKVRVLSVVCMSTGDVLEIGVDSSNNLNTLRQWLKKEGYLDPSELYLVTEEGQIITPKEETEPLTAFFQPGCYMSTVYLYSTSLQPSFKLVRQVLPDVTDLLTKGDKNINEDDRPTTYGHVFFHLREFWRLFKRLHGGHKSMVHIIHDIEKDLRSFVNGDALMIEFSKCIGVADHIIKSVTLDRQRLISSKDRMNADSQCNIDMSLSSWLEGVDNIKAKMEEMQSCLSEVHRVQKEAEEVLTTTEVMNQRHMCSLEHFEKFKADYVDGALTILEAERAHVEEHDNMSDLLQLATHTAEIIIQDHLNGVDFLAVYLKLTNLLGVAESLNSKVNGMKNECDRVTEKVHSDMWSMVLTSMVRQVSVTSINSDSFRPYSRNDSVSSVNSVASASRIIQRMKSIPRSLSSSEESDGPNDVDSLMGSLREHLQQMRRTNQAEVSRNKTILSSLESPPTFKVGGIDEVPVEQEDYEITPMNSTNSMFLDPTQSLRLPPN